MSSSDEVGGGGWAVSPDTRRALRLATARQAVRRHDFRRAVLEAEELLDEVPDDVDALWTLAESAMELRDFEVALETWKALVRAGVLRAPVWTQLGACAFETCAFEEAADAARKAIALHEDAGDAWYLLGLCTERLEDVDHAWPCFERAHRCSPLGFPLPLPLDDDDARDLVREALAELPPELARFWSPVPLRIEGLPEKRELTTPMPPISPRVLALYAGTAPASPDGRARPTALRIYRTNLTHHESRDDALDALVEALEQEALDWFPDDGA